MDEPQADGSASTPRGILIRWANRQEAWVRVLVSAVLRVQGPVGDDDIDEAFSVFLREKRLVPSDEALAVPPLASASDSASPEDSLAVLRLSEVSDVNALAADQMIGFDQRLTVLFGPNGSGKSGYARIIKRASGAGARGDAEILGDVYSEADTVLPRARFEVEVDGTERVVDWRNEERLAPLDRISVFDSDLAAVHVDADLGYMVTPTELLRFRDVTNAIQAVQSRIRATAATRRYEATLRVNPFTRGTRVHEIVEGLSHTSPVDELQRLAQLDDSEARRLAQLSVAYADLTDDGAHRRADGLRGQLRDVERLLEILAGLEAFDVDRYNTSLREVNSAQAELEELRESLFAADELAAAPDAQWQSFIEAGRSYAEHLGLHQYPQYDDRCIYCRQPLEPQALALLRRYGAFLTGKAQTKLSDAKAALEATTLRVERSQLERMRDAFGDTQESSDTDKTTHALLNDALITLEQVESQRICADHRLPPRATSQISAVSAIQDRLTDELRVLTESQSNGTDSIQELRAELDLLKDRRSLAEHLPTIRQCVEKAKGAHKLQASDQQISNSTLSTLTRASTKASQDLINSDFAQHFEAECVALKAPSVKLGFRGSSGSALREKRLVNLRPSRILSEGEQKLLALADFLAECRMSGRRDPILFDDPVSSLDYVRLESVAKRLSDLADEHQVIVFTHNIMFVAALLELRSKNSQRITMLQVGEHHGRKGVIAEDIEPRLDTPNKLRARINDAIQEAHAAEPGTQDRHISRIYGLLRSWCEGFVEQELLGDVAHRYRANIMMGRLHAIKPERMREAIAGLEDVFNRASRHIDGHSNPDEAQSAPPKIEDVEEDWNALQLMRTNYMQR